MPTVNAIQKAIARLNSTNPEAEGRAIERLGQRYAERIIRLYSPDMVKAFYAHYQALYEAEHAVGDPTMACYYLALSDELYVHINEAGGEDDTA